LASTSGASIAGFVLTHLHIASGGHKQETAAMRVFLLVIVVVPLSLVGCMGGNGHQRDMGPGSYDDPSSGSIVDPPKKPKKRPRRKPQPDEPPPDDCFAHQVACFESKLSKEPGGVHGTNRCQDCKDQCVAEGVWPLYTWYQGRCDWWSYVKGSLAGLP
jgi:hypothetical protein